MNNLLFLQEFLNNNKVCRENGFEVFQKSWTYYQKNKSSKDFLTKVNNFLKTPYYLYSSEAQNKINNFPDIFKLKQNEIEKLEYFLNLYIVLKDLKKTIKNPESTSNIFIDNKNIPLIQDEFPIGFVNENLNKGTKYTFNELKNKEDIMISQALFKQKTLYM